MNKKIHEAKLVSVITPGLPMWGIFYVEGAPDDLFVSPVVALAVIEEKAGHAVERVVRPLCYSQDTGVDDWYEASDALGYLLGEEVPKAKEIFAGTIAREKRRGESAQIMKKGAKAGG